MSEEVRGKLMNALIIGNNTKHAKIFSVFCEKVYILLPKNSNSYRYSSELKEFISIISETECTDKRYKTTRIKEIRNVVSQNNIGIVLSNRKDDMVLTNKACKTLKIKPILLVTFHNSYSWFNPFKVFLLSLLIRFNSDGVICLSSFVYKKLRFLFFGKNRLLFQPNTVDYRNYLLKEDYSISHCLNICYTGVIQKEKNQLFLIKIIKTIKTIKDVKLNLYGDVKNQKYYDYLKRKIHDWGLENNVFFYGKVENEKIKELLISNDLYMSASCLEMSPYNILEAKASGMPIIASNVPGQRDLILDGSDGFLYKANSISHAVNIILRVTNDLILRKKIGNSARIYVQDTNSFIVAGKQAEEFASKIARSLRK